jgi:hypothetical protein
MPNYTKGQIYMLEPKCEYEEGDVYYGSTIQPLSKRVGLHRSKSNLCLSKILIEKYGEVKIVLVKLFPCNSKQELEAEEAKYIRENKCINKKIPLRTRKEYREENKEKTAEYYEDNKEHIKEKSKDWYENNKEKMKEYREVNKEKNKEKMKEYFKEKITCDCGCIVLKCSLNRHKKSKKHLINNSR